MRMTRFSKDYPSYAKKSKWGKKKVSVTKQETGEQVTLRVKSRVPDKCSAPRRICISCKTNKIHKLSKYYDSKICGDCTTSASA